MSDFVFDSVYGQTWQDVEEAAVDGIVELSINPSEQAQALARHVAARAYEAAIVAAQVDIAFARNRMESFEDFFSAVDEALEERLSVVRRHNDRD